MNTTNGVSVQEKNIIVNIPVFLCFTKSEISEIK